MCLSPVLEWNEAAVAAVLGGDAVSCSLTGLCVACYCWAAVVVTHPIFSMGISHTSSSMLPPAVPAGWRIKAGLGPRLYISESRGWGVGGGGGHTMDKGMCGVGWGSVGAGGKRC